jgi:hypothetical protein
MPDYSMADFCANDTFHLNCIVKNQVRNASGSHKFSSRIPGKGDQVLETRGYPEKMAHEVKTTGCSHTGALVPDGVWGKGRSPGIAG